MRPHAFPGTAPMVDPSLHTDAAPLVLIVDDDEAMREHLGAVFHGEGYRVSHAKDGLEAVEKALHLSPSVMVMDLCLPRYDGCSATRQLKAATRTSVIPVVALTGDERQDAILRAWEAGCEAFFNKPPDIEALILCVRGLIGARETCRDFRE